MFEKILLSVFLAFSVSMIKAQQLSPLNDSVGIESLIQNEPFKIPDLDSCIQSAIHSSPLLQVSNEEIVKLVEELRIQKKSWLSYIQLDANTRYGLFNQLQFSQSSEGGADVGVQTAKEQFNYYAGITFKVPLSYFVSNKSEQKIIKSGIKAVELRNAELKREISKVVISEYFSLKRLQELMVVQQNNLQTVRLGYMKASRDLNNNLISIDDYASSSTSYTKVLESYISTKNEFYAQYYLMKILIGVNTNSNTK